MLQESGTVFENQRFAARRESLGDSARGERGDAGCKGLRLARGDLARRRGGWT